MPYIAPLKDMLFAMRELADLPAIAALPGCEDATSDVVEEILNQHAKFCADVLAPLNASADRAPSVWHEGRVTTAAGFKEAFKAYGDAGWQGVQHPVVFGGQGLPKLLAAACTEMLNSANLAFALCPLLTDSAIEALFVAGSEQQQATYLPHFISGKWTGTMNLTEPQAGSDLAAIKTRAVPQPDGSYRIFGTKIFITYGEHDMAENIVHMVLARTPNAPPGVKGISLFIVPKFFSNADGSSAELGERNDVHCVSLEHKMGIKASPTAVLQFGDHGGAIGSLVGLENHGLEYMFIMMNSARFCVGLQGIALAERAYQKAVQFSKERVQSRDLLNAKADPVTIIHHPDVRRMLMMMRAQIEAGRALAYVAAAACDNARHHADADERLQSQAFYEYLVPIVKGWCTEMSIDVASTSVQVHGGMGFIEDTGVAQYYRDAKILTIYEGTTAIQANDLISRKTMRDGGATARAIIVQIRATEQTLLAEKQSQHAADLQAIAKQLSAACNAMEEVVSYVVTTIQTDMKAVFAGSVLYLKLAGIVLGGWQMARAALIAEQKLSEAKTDQAFYQAKIVTARFFAEHILPHALAYRSAIIQGGASVLGLTEEQF